MYLSRVRFLPPVSDDCQKRHMSDTGGRLIFDRKRGKKAWTFFVVFSHFPPLLSRVVPRLFVLHQKSRSKIDQKFRRPKLRVPKALYQVSTGFSPWVKKPLSSVLHGALFSVQSSSRLTIWKWRIRKLFRFMSSISYWRLGSAAHAYDAASSMQRQKPQCSIQNCLKHKWLLVAANNSPWPPTGFTRIESRSCLSWGFEEKNIVCWIYSPVLMRLMLTCWAFSLLPVP